MRRKSWLKLFVCRKNLPSASNHSSLRKTAGSEDKRKRTSRQTSFQQLCSIIIAEAHPDEDINGIQESDHTVVYHVTEEADDHLNCSADDDNSSSSVPGDHVIVLDDQMDNADQSSSGSDIEHIILNGETITAIEEQTQEYVSAFIQIALMRFLAEKDSSEQRKAAGLGRMHKVQKLFKGRNTCLSTTKRLAQKKQFRKSRGLGIYGAKPYQSSMVKLLNKQLAHELAVSTPEMKPVLHAYAAEKLHLSEESEKPYSLWHWLERWLAHTSSNPQHLRSYNSSECGSRSACSDEDQEANLPAQEEKTVLPGTEIPIPFSPNADSGLSAIEHEGYQFHTSSVKMKIQIPLSSIDIEVDSFTINGKDQYEHINTEDSMTVISNSSQVPSESATTLDNDKSGSVEIENAETEVSSDRTFFDCVETEVKSPVRPRSRHNQATSRRTRRSLDHSKDVSIDSTNGSFGSALSASHSVEINIETTRLVEYAASHDSGFKLDFIANSGTGTDATLDLESTYMTKESTFSNSNGSFNESKEKMTCYKANVEHYSTVTATSNIYKKYFFPTKEIGPSSRGSSPRMHVVVPESQVRVEIS